jgi:hypothetical protein
VDKLSTAEVRHETLVLVSATVTVESGEVNLTILKVSGGSTTLTAVVGEAIV